MGLAGIPRLLYKLGGGHCEDNSFSPLSTILKEYAGTLSTAQRLMKTINGKTVYLFKTTDMLNAKVNQVISSLRLMSNAFTGWQNQFATLAQKQQCHFNLQQQFLALYAMDVNKALTSILRLTEVNDILGQLATLPRKNLASFSDLPQFLSDDLQVKLSTASGLANTIDALKSGFALLMEPLIDYQLDPSRTMNLHIMLTLPTLDTKDAFCSMEHLVPLTYKVNNSCYGGTMARHDLVLLTCGNKRYVVKQTDLQQCLRDQTTVLCPVNVLSTVKNPSWLGLKWTPQTRLSFNHAHFKRPNCHALNSLVHISGRFYFSAAQTNLSIHTNNGPKSILLQPFSIFHFPCDVSFSQQRMGLGVCPKKLQFQFPLFHEGQFKFLPWEPVAWKNLTSYRTKDFHIPTASEIDNSTFESLENTYETLDQDLTYRLQKVRKDISNFHSVDHVSSLYVLVYLSIGLTSCNFIVITILYCIFRKNHSLFVKRNFVPRAPEGIPLPVTQSTSTY